MLHYYLKWTAMRKEFPCDDIINCPGRLNIVIMRLKSMWFDDNKLNLRDMICNLPLWSHVAKDLPTINTT